MPGRTSSAMTPPWTLTASGTSSPARASRTERATATPAFSCASSVLAPRCGVATTCLELEQRRVGAGLLGVDVETGRRDPALLEGRVQGVLVDDAAAGGVDQDQRRLDGRELLGADDADGLGRLGQVHRDHVAGAQQLVQADQADPHLRGAAGGHEGVVGDDVHPEGREPLRDERADPAEADDAGGLLVELDPGVLAALPLALPQRRVGRRDVAGGGQQQPDRQLGGAHDVGLRRVDDHDAGLGRGLHVDVVQADAGAGHDLEPAGGREHLGVHAGGAADEDRRRRRRPPPAGPAGRCRRPSAPRSPARGPRRSRARAPRRSGRRGAGLGWSPGHRRRALVNGFTTVRLLDARPGARLVVGCVVGLVVLGGSRCGAG